eukprot:COSAG02_NODE_15226_length_1192_cov_1.767612_1_plen_192_part_10
MHNPIVLSLKSPSDRLAEPAAPVIHNEPGRLNVWYSGDARRGWFFRSVAQAAFANYESKNHSQPAMGIEALLLLSKAGEAFSLALQERTLCASSNVAEQWSQGPDKRQQYELEAALIDTAQTISYLYHELESVCTCGLQYCRECTGRHQDEHVKKTHGKSRSRNAPFAQQGWWEISPLDLQEIPQHIGVHGI